jgi:hypothetical protein
MLFAYNMDDVDRLSHKLGIPWERTKDQPFADETIYIGLIWNLSTLMVSLGHAKKEKYLLAIADWISQPTHTLNEVQKIYSKLRHACLIVPRGQAYLTSLEAMLSICSDCPFMPHRAHKGIAADLSWWAAILNQKDVSRPIPGPVQPHDLNAFSDASSGIGIGITIGEQWRAWRLIPGWQTLNGQRDIGWAKAVGFELLVHAISDKTGGRGDFKVYGDNMGVVEGWWNLRSRNPQVNAVFQRIHSFIDEAKAISIHSAYVPSAHNPADAPSRGIYPACNLLLPAVALPLDLHPFLIDATLPLSSTEQRLLREGRYPAAAEKFIRTISSAGTPATLSPLVSFKDSDHAS